MPSLSHTQPPKAACSLGARGVWLRFHVRPNTFGNALGNSIAGSLQPQDNRALLNAANQAADPDYYKPPMPDQTDAETARLNAYEDAATPFNERLSKRLYDKYGFVPMLNFADNKSSQPIASAYSASKLKSGILPNDPESVLSRGYVDSKAACLAIPMLSLDDANVLQKAMPVIGNNGFSDFATGGVRTLLFNGDASLVPVVRTRMELFTTTAINAFNQSKLDAVVNGEQYKFNAFSYAAAMSGNISDPTDVKPIGLIVSNGKVIAGNSSPETFFVAQTKNSQGKIETSFGFGDPPSNARVAFGGGIPIIVDGLVYGVGNKYEPGTVGAPISGDPGKFADQLIQRNNNGYVALDQKDRESGAALGKVIIAYSSESNVLAVVIQENGAAKPLSISGIRDRLYAAGFDNAIAFDGSDSATLVRNGTVKIQPAARKNSSTTVGIGVKRNGK